MTNTTTWISSTIKSLFCKHDYYKKTWRVKESSLYRYSERLYCCEKCEKEKWVHGDYDKINALTKEEKEFLLKWKTQNKK